jgi:hypothetical protein
VGAERRVLHRAIDGMIFIWVNSVNLGKSQRIRFALLESNRITTRHNGIDWIFFVSRRIRRVASIGDGRFDRAFSSMDSVSGKVKRIVRAPGCGFGVIFFVCFPAVLTVVVYVPFRSRSSSVCVAVTSRALCVTLGRGVSLLSNSSCDRARVRVRVRAEETTNTRVVRGEQTRVTNQHS